MTLLKTIFEFLGYFTIIASIFSFCVKIYIQKKTINSLSEKWQKHIKGDWYPFGITYIGKKNEITGYHWTFRYNFWKGKFVGRGQSLRDDKVSYKVIKLDLKGDYIFLLGECNNHSGEIIIGILHEIYPIATTEKMTGVFTGLSYESRLPHTTEFYFSN